MDKILKIQSEIGVLSKTETNPFFKSKYMDINGLLAQLLPLLEKYQLCVTQPLCEVSGKPTLMTEVYDIENKQSLIKGFMPLPDLQDPQKMGSAITYYRRYSLQSLFLLQAQDDDANNASEKTVQIGEYKKPMNKKELGEMQKRSQADYVGGTDPFLN